jgi:probable F420-dependent oxidoreductase
MTTRAGPRSDFRIGVHTGLEHTSTADLLDFWRWAEDVGFDWISVWDHLLPSQITVPDPTRFTPSVDGCLEAVSAHAALAMATSRVRCGSLVYCVGYRHVSVLALAMATIDQLSGGRCEAGLGAGWAKAEYDAFGVPFPGAGARLDQLEETAEVLRALLHGSEVSFEGRHVTLRKAARLPAPVQDRLPLWIGGGGERRTLRIAAAHADGWNVAFVPPEVFSSKLAVLHGHCEDLGRDPHEIRVSVNVGVVAGEADLSRRFGAATERVRPAVLIGSAAQMAQTLSRYRARGADQINVAVRAPWDRDVLERVLEAARSLA